jgi:hypothetical protein
MFRILGVVPRWGRLPTAAMVDGIPDVLLSGELWRAMYGADTTVVGRVAIIDGAPVHITGIGPSAFTNVTGAPGPRPLWMSDGVGYDAANAELEAVALLQPGVSVDSASRTMATEYSHTRCLDDAMSACTMDVVALHGAIDLPPVQRPDAFYARYGAVVAALLLLLACLNVAGLLMAQAIARRAEFAVRMALGADRRRLMQQLLVEYVSLAMIGAILGAGLCRIAVELWGDATVAQFLTPEPLVFISVALVAWLGGVAAGLQVAYRAGQVPLAEVLRDGGAAASARGGWQARLLTVQYALTMPIVFAAVLLGRVGVLSQAPDPVTDELKDRLLIVTVGWAGAGTGWRTTADRLDQALDSLIRRPDIGRLVPDRSERRSGHVSVGERSRDVIGRTIAPGFLATIGQPLSRGSEAQAWSDSADAVIPIVVSDRLARDLFGEEDPVDRRIGLSGIGGRNVDSARITGVISTSALEAVDGSDAPDLLFTPVRSRTADRYLIQTTTAAATVAPVVERLLRERAPELLRTVRTVQDQQAAVAAGQLWIATFVVAVAALVALLAAAGVTAVTSVAVAARWREMAVRLVLGASHGLLLRLLVGRSLRLCLVGIVISLPFTAVAILLAVSDPSAWLAAAVAWCGAALALLGVAAGAAGLAVIPVFATHPAEVLRVE